MSSALGANAAKWLLAASLFGARVRTTTSQPRAQTAATLPRRGGGLTLGAFVEFSLSVKDARQSQKFFESLGFESTPAPHADYAMAAVTDGMIVIALHQAEFQSPALTYYGSDLSACIPVLEASGTAFTVLQKENGEASQIAFTDSNGQHVILQKRASPYPANLRFRMIPQAGPQATNTSFSKLGMLGEYSIATQDRAASAAFWRLLGFEKTHESDTPYPWGIYSDGRTVIGIHQTTEFKKPALSFFSKNSAERISALKKEGFQFSLEMDPTNAVLKSPDGQMLFVFYWP